MRVLVIGGTGFIGTRVVRALRAHEVTVYHPNPSKLMQDNVRHLLGSREQLGAYRPIFREIDPDIVVDMVSRNAVDARLTVQNLGEVVDRFVVISSGSVYRNYGVFLGSETAEIDNRPAQESSPLRRKLYPYRGLIPCESDNSKAWLCDFDKILMEKVFKEETTVPFNIVRLPMVYGPGDPDHRLIPYVRRMLEDDSIIFLQESAARWRNARAYVDNIAHAIALVVERGEAGKVYNVAEPQDFPEEEWVCEIGRQVGWRGCIRYLSDSDPGGRPPIKEFPEGTNFRQHLRFDTTRIRQELGYEEIVPTDTALEATVQAYRKHLPF
ncbi:hypothetical protein CDG76_34590 [Nostoc sp. 'Peltigera membranacea cyanobiont' 210A]|uniref:NAD-dependent epimerase/dehydratase family protein n=1 Tax=Nostoc sp. 'Peltigera membranacea cyanobiont' 210A TaxID=2014529 RepID=UPI000B95AB78|nr:NAD-dependent epimerase/dehydratase family protein [Nostoc sp. 'Peltigera membranacea cyanobiont' 210A]OYD89708.1 hypothetical protein CDG76_34590 [Nostoc sp. 'Peltigera membranacea cyanobiont' 210A]